MKNTIPVLGIINGALEVTDKLLDVIKNSIRTPEERLIRLRIKEVMLTARANFGADKKRMKALRLKLKQCEKNMSRAIKHNLPTEDIKADVEIMVSQMRKIFDEDGAIDKVKSEKIERLRNRLTNSIN